jgi:long-subunit acyl-CoA synthetase (AMP-forming)
LAKGRHHISHKLTNNTSFIGYIALNLTPTIVNDGKPYKFVGIYGKNREEWVFTHLANYFNTTTTAAFYDTLGPSAVEFVIKQTELTTISCSSNYIAGLVKLKKEGKAKSLEHIIAWDAVAAELKEEAKQNGVAIHLFDEVVAAGRELETVEFNEP